MSMPSEDVSFWRIAAQQPDRVAIVDADGRQITAAELLVTANRLVHGLRRLGLSSGHVLAVSIGNHAALLELYFAAMQAGFYFLPLCTRFVPAEIAHILGDAEVSVLVTDETNEAAVARSVELASFAREHCFSTGASSAFTRLESITDGMSEDLPDDRSCGERMHYTSGTTGRPKAVRRPLRPGPPDLRCAITASRHLATVGIRPFDGSIHLVSSPLYHSASLLWCTNHLHLGHTVVLNRRWAPESTLDAIERHRVTSTLMVPTHFHRLLALPEETRTKYDVSSLRHVVHGGAPCPIHLKRAMLSWLGPVVYEAYGATEGGGCHVGPDDWLARPGTVGKPGRSIRVLRDDGTDCAPGEVGNIYFQSFGTSFEYFKDPQKTAAARKGDLFTVGDVGYFDEDGWLFLCARKSDVILSGGVNVYPAEVESVLLSHPKVRDAIVFGVPSEEWGEQVKAVVEPEGEPSDTLREELNAYCRERLAGFKCPRTIDFVPSLERDPETGKIDRKRFTMMATARNMRASMPRPPPIVRSEARSGSVTSYWQDAVFAWEQRRSPSNTWTRPMRVRLRGPLDAGAFAEAVRRVVHRQEALRYTFDRRTRSTALCEASDIPVDVLDARADPKVLDGVARTLVASVFPLEGEPLIRFAIVRTGEEEHVLVVAWHQVVHDAGRGALLVSELLETHRALVEDSASMPPEPEIRFVDHAVWERRWYEGEGRAIVDAARNYIAGAIPLPLPTDRPRDGLASADAVCAGFVLGREESARHAKLVRSLGTSSTGSIAMVSVVLSRITGIRDVTVLTPLHPRLPSSLTKTMGRFMISAPARVSLEGRPTISEMFKRAGAAIRAQAYSSAPAPLVYETNDVFDHPLNRVILNLPHREPMPESVAGIGIVNETEPNPPGARSELVVRVATQNDRIVGQVTAAARLFDVSTIRTWCKMLERAYAVAEPDARIDDLRLD